MARRFEVDKINLNIREIDPFANNKYTGFVIGWNSDIGFGEYTLYRDVKSSKWYAHSEHMDSNEDKAFLKELLKLFVDRLEITE
jgi:hypothetical protein